MYSEGGGRVAAVAFLPLPPLAAMVSSSHATAVAGCYNGAVTLWDVTTTAPAPTATGAAAARKVGMAWVASVRVSSHPVTCLDVGRLDAGTVVAAGASDGSLSLLRVGTGSSSDGGGGGGGGGSIDALEVAERVTVAPATAPTVLRIDPVNKALLAADARGGVALYDLAALTHDPTYSATLEGGSGPHAFDACFSSQSPFAVLVAAYVP